MSNHLLTEKDAAPIVGMSRAWLQRKRWEGLEVRTVGFPGDPCISRCTGHPLDGRILANSPDQGMFATTATDDQDIHGEPPPARCSSLFQTITTPSISTPVERQQSIQQGVGHPVPVIRGSEKLGVLAVGDVGHFDEDLDGDLVAAQNGWHPGPALAHHVVADRLLLVDGQLVFLETRQDAGGELAGKAL